MLSITRLLLLAPLVLAVNARAQAIPLPAPAAALAAKGATFSPDYMGNYTRFLTVGDHWAGTDADLVSLAKLTATERVGLAGDKAADAFLPHLAEMPALKSLELGNVSFTESQRKYLQALNITGLQITGKLPQGLALHGLAKLRELAFDEVEFQSLSVDALPVLESLKIGSDYKHYGQSVELKLHNLPLLKELQLVEVKPGALPLAEFPRLESLMLFNAPVDDGTLGHLAVLKNLKKLGLTRSGNSATAWASLTESHLTSLGITLPTDEQFLGLKDISQLEELDLGGDRITSRSVVRLREAPKLNSLNLEGAKIDAAAMGSVVTLKELRELNLGRSTADDQALLQLVDLPKLYALYLGSTRITDASLPALAKIAGLHDVDIRQTGVTAAGVAALRQSAPKLRVVSDFKGAGE